MYSHILLTTDGSELAAKGVEHGLVLAKVLGAKATLLLVNEPISLSDLQAAANGGVANPLDRYEEQMEARFRKISAPTEEKARALGVPLQVLRETENVPAEAIVRAAKEHGIDLIVMASHGRRGLSKLLLGSQTAEVLVRTTTPVLVVR
ncbi:universal stress protein [Pelagibacterium limicola]|uniref:universal stress protein n=1 Tax=Pelagibacterium limicola TaxID=2791022 RepID=UPI0018AF673C|nr:universal stress protein [Pelagibacterium limicola]